MHICSLVTLAEQREAVTKLDASATPGEGRKTAWVTAEAMERWLVEVGFLEELFGSSMHVELVSRVCARALARDKLLKYNLQYKMIRDVRS